MRGNEYYRTTQVNYVTLQTKLVGRLHNATVQFGTTQCYISERKYYNKIAQKNKNCWCMWPCQEVKEGQDQDIKGI